MFALSKGYFPTQTCTVLLKKVMGDFPGGPGVKVTLPLQIPGWGTKVLPAMWGGQKKIIKDINKFKKLVEDFPGGPGAENPPANAGDTDWIPGLRRFHMPRCSLAHVPQLLRLI